jgi:pyridoxal phosphate enzyme (YggS family)
VSIANNLQIIEERILAACESCGRKRDEVKLIGVSKLQSAASIAQAHAAGLNDVGENYIQEYAGKREELSELALNWHIIGQIQSNKVRRLLSLGPCIIHSIDRLSLVRRIQTILEENTGLLEPLRIFIELRIGDEGSQKSGVKESDVEEILDFVDSHACFKVEGLMLIPPYYDEPEKARPYFRRLRQIQERLNQGRKTPLRHLSMGMSGDFEVAIQEGATHIRVGTAIFGTRA